MPPPRPLAGLPPADPVAVARAWLVRRLGDAPLEAAPVLAAPTFVELAPALCGSLLAALVDPAALDALPSEAAGLRALVDPRVPATGTAVRAAEQLRAAALDVLLPATDPALHAALHDRLAHACSRLVDGVEERRRDAGEAITVRDARAAVGGLEDPRPEDSREGPSGPMTLEDSGEGPSSPMLLDDSREGPSGPMTLDDPRGGVPPSRSRDPRSALTAEAERLVLARTRFALLAVEIEDAAVLPAGILAAGEASLRAALPAGALHAPDGPGSLLVLAVEADGRGLARTLTGAAGGAAGHRGAPLRAAAGVAEHPRDGNTPEGLLAHADGQLFAARAAGLPLA